jgi:hypothetical protein
MAKRTSGRGRTPRKATARKRTGKKGAAKAINQLKKPQRRKAARKPSTKGTASGKIVPQLPSPAGSE